MWTQPICRPTNRALDLTAMTVPTKRLVFGAKQRCRVNRTVLPNSQYLTSRDPLTPSKFAKTASTTALRMLALYRSYQGTQIIPWEKGTVCTTRWAPTRKKRVAAWTRTFLETISAPGQLLSTSSGLIKFQSFVSPIPTKTWIFRFTDSIGTCGKTTAS